MSKMAELFTEIQYQLDKDLHPIMIANHLGIPVTMVYDVIEASQDEDLSPYQTINS
jgi:hypothetical protein